MILNLDHNVKPTLQFTFIDHNHPIVCMSVTMPINMHSGSNHIFAGS